MLNSFPHKGLNVDLRQTQNMTAVPSQRQNHLNRTLKSSPHKSRYQQPQNNTMMRRNQQYPKKIQPLNMTQEMQSISSSQRSKMLNTTNKTPFIRRPKEMLIQDYEFENYNNNVPTMFDNQSLGLNTTRHGMPQTMDARGKNLSQAQQLLNLNNKLMKQGFLSNSNDDIGASQNQSCNYYPRQSATPSNLFSRTTQNSSRGIHSKQNYRDQKQYQRNQVGTPGITQFSHFNTACTTSQNNANFLNIQTGGGYPQDSQRNNLSSSRGGKQSLERSFEKYDKQEKIAKIKKIINREKVKFTKQLEKIQSLEHNEIVEKEQSTSQLLNQSNNKLHMMLQGQSQAFENNHNRNSKTPFRQSENKLLETGNTKNMAQIPQSKDLSPTQRKGLLSTMGVKYFKIQSQEVNTITARGGEQNSIGSSKNMLGYEIGIKQGSTRNVSYPQRRQSSTFSLVSGSSSFRRKNKNTEVFKVPDGVRNMTQLQDAIEEAQNSNQGSAETTDYNSSVLSNNKEKELVPNSEEWVRKKQEEAKVDLEKFNYIRKLEKRFEWMKSAERAKDISKTMQAIQAANRHRQWKINKDQKKKYDIELNQVIQEYKSKSVARQKQSNREYSQKCRIAIDPITQYEAQVIELGNPCEVIIKNRDKALQILKTKGKLKDITSQEKYLNMFKNYEFKKQQEKIKEEKKMQVQRKQTSITLRQRLSFRGKTSGTDLNKNVEIQIHDYDPQQDTGSQKKQISSQKSKTITQYTPTLKSQQQNSQRSTQMKHLQKNNTLHLKLQQFGKNQVSHSNSNHYIQVNDPVEVSKSRVNTQPSEKDKSKAVSNKVRTDRTFISKDSKYFDKDNSDRLNNLDVVKNKLAKPQNTFRSPYELSPNNADSSYKKVEDDLLQSLSNSSQDTSISMDDFRSEHSSNQSTGDNNIQIAQEDNMLYNQLQEHSISIQEGNDCKQQSTIQQNESSVGNFQFGLANNSSKIVQRAAMHNFAQKQSTAQTKDTLQGSTTDNSKPLLNLSQQQYNQVQTNVFNKNQKTQRQSPTSLFELNEKSFQSSVQQNTSVDNSNTMNSPLIQASMSKTSRQFSKNATISQEDGQKIIRDKFKLNQIKFKEKDQKKKEQLRIKTSPQHKKLVRQKSKKTDFSFSDNQSMITMDVSRKLQRVAHFFTEEQLEMLKNIFSNEDYNFTTLGEYEDDGLIQMDEFQKKVFYYRPKIKDLLKLISNDDQWSYISNKEQFRKIMDLVNKNYGYTESLSIIEEQNKRIKKKLINMDKGGQFIDCDLDHEHTEECKNVRALKTKEKDVLNCIFDVQKFLKDKNVVQRYSQYLNKLMFQTKDRFIKRKRQEYLDSLKDQSEEIDFFTRMKIDQMIKQGKIDKVNELRQEEEDRQQKKLDRIKKRRRKLMKEQMERGDSTSQQNFDATMTSNISMLSPSKITSGISGQSPSKLDGETSSSQSEEEETKDDQFTDLAKKLKITYNMAQKISMLTQKKNGENKAIGVIVEKHKTPRQQVIHDLLNQTDNVSLLAINNNKITYRDNKTMKVADVKLSGFDEINYKIKTKEDHSIAFQNTDVMRKPYIPKRKKLSYKSNMSLNFITKKQLSQIKEESERRRRESELLKLDNTQNSYLSELHHQHTTDMISEERESVLDDYMPPNPKKLDF